MCNIEVAMYSLWLVPKRDTEAYALLDQLIRDAAAQYRTPVFGPHATLQGGIEGAERDVRERACLLAGELSPYEITLGEIGSNGIYFQILFFKVDRTPSVLNANALARKVFGMDKGDYSPHISLAYGDLSKNQVDTLQQFIAQERAIEGTRFMAESIELWYAEGAIEEWYRVETFPFRKA